MQAALAAMTLGLAMPASAAVLCQKASGALYVRTGGCKKKEVAVSAADIGAVGAKGDTGAPGSDGTPGAPGTPGRSALTPLQHGETESGACGLGFHAGSGSDQWYLYQQFSIPLSAAVGVSNVIAVSGPSATHCPGIGQADAGYLCVYVTDTSNASAGSIYNVETGFAGAGKYGFDMQVIPAAAGDAFLNCVYSVSAP